MTFPGSRTKTTDAWLLPEDEALMGQRIRDVLPDAGWLCSQPGPVGLHEVHLHPTVEEALSCGGVQAFLLLPVGAAAPPGVVTTAGAIARPGLRHAAAVQLLRSRHVPDRCDEISRHGEIRDGEASRHGEVRAGEVFEAGRLAVSWNEPEVGPELHPLLTEQTRRIWQALRSATRPAALADPTGRKISGTRIGPAAHDLVTRTGMPLIRRGTQRLRLATAPSRGRSGG
ncbi:hypothetical protein [Streptomyces sp. PTD5-9]|uniref:hypothetical protein n=1 Tax=Streptomyces sp. PTD5-9 TaxID=3120150 RepID=UPI00300A61CE